MKLLKSLVVLLATADAAAAQTSDSALPEHCQLDQHGQPLHLPVTAAQHVTGWGMLDARVAANEVALTIDDGPFPWNTNTADMLDVLLQHDVRATFFVVGQYVEERPDLLQAMVDAGHELAVHTFSHTDMTTLTVDQRRQEIRKTLDAIHAAVPGYRPRYWRPPYGATNEQVRDEVLHEFGLAQALWSLDTEDWKFENRAADIAASLLQAQGHVVLLHDGAQNSDQTVLAVRDAVPQLLEQGAAFVSMSQLDLHAAGCADVDHGDGDGEETDSDGTDYSDNSDSDGSDGESDNSGSDSSDSSDSSNSDDSSDSGANHSVYSRRKYRRKRRLHRLRRKLRHLRYRHRRQQSSESDHSDIRRAPRHY